MFDSNHPELVEEFLMIRMDSIRAATTHYPPIPPPEAEDNTGIVPKYIEMQTELTNRNYHVHDAPVYSLDWLTNMHDDFCRNPTIDPPEELFYCGIITDGQPCDTAAFPNLSALNMHLRVHHNIKSVIWFIAVSNQCCF